MTNTHFPNGDPFEFIRGREEIFADRGDTHIAVFPRLRWFAAVVVRWSRWGGGLLRASWRFLMLGLVLALALAHAAIRRVTVTPTGPALARSRAAWLHRWSVLACAVLGLEVEFEGFVPASGLVIVNHMNWITVLLLSSVAPFVFVLDLELRRRPVIGDLACLAGTLFRDRRRRRDVARINFLVARALQRRQLVVICRSCEWNPAPILSGFPSALLQPAADQPSTLTAAAIRLRSGAGHGRRDLPAIGRSGLEILMQPRSFVTIAFHPPVFHHGNRKELAAQLWHEVRTLERSERSWTFPPLLWSIAPSGVTGRRRLPIKETSLVAPSWTLDSKRPFSFGV